MPPPELDLFAFARGSITAPAGCGKTQLIVDTLGLHRDAKPILVLTHTNAGAAALRLRLQRNRVASSSHRVMTLDGLALRIIGMFPLRSGHHPDLLQINTPRDDYPAIRSFALRLLQARHIHVPLMATYSRVIVDEYQDCNLTQHAIVDALASVLPTAVLGDPMQAIFGFAGNNLVNWQRDVEDRFPAQGLLGTPWRWRNAGTEAFGRWLLHAREQLQEGRNVSLMGAPREVQWIQLNRGTEDQQRRVAAQTRAGRDETVLVIGDARNPTGRHQLASQTPGATSVDAVDLGELIRFAQRFNLGDANALQQLVELSGSLMTQVGSASMLSRIETIRMGRARSPATPAEASAVTFATTPSISAALELLDRLEQQPNARVFRPSMLHCLRSGLRSALAGEITLLEGVLRSREQFRHLGRSISRRAIGSTLLLKGLEADVAVLLQPDQMDASNLYVALTRGARRLLVCSETAELMPVQQVR